MFGRDSINNAGLIIKSTVHYANNYDNAFWSGTQMVYGDAENFVHADDVVAHKLSTESRSTSPACSITTNRVRSTSRFRMCSANWSISKMALARIQPIRLRRRGYDKWCASQHG